jgi:protein-S-isoprenylcysteine O-methyltransferase Ste14
MSKFGGYTVDGVPQKEEKNRGAQILMALALGLIFVVPWLVVLVFFRHGHPAPAGGSYDRSTHVSVAAVAAIVALDVALLIVIAVRMARTSSN